MTTLTGLHQSPPDRGNCHGATCAAGGWAALGGEDLVAAAFSAGRMILGEDANARLAPAATCSDGGTNQGDKLRMVT